MSSTIPGNDLIANLLQQKHLVSSLLKTGKLAQDQAAWTFHKDQEYVSPALSLTDILSDKVVNVPESGENVESVHQLMERLANWREAVLQKDVSLSADHHKLWFSLQPKTFPKLKNPSISIDAVKKLLADETLIVSICSYSGFNFSTEYSLVYKGSFSPLRAYDDLLGIIKKALKSSDPVISNEKLIHFSSYILKRALWEYMLYLDIFQHAFVEHFPDVKNFTTSKNIAINHMRVFIGKDVHGELGFTVRLEDEVILLDSVANRPHADHLLKLVYYHDYTLDLRSVNLFTEVMTQSMESVEAMLSLNPELAKLLDESNRAIRFFLVFPSLVYLPRELHEHIPTVLTIEEKEMHLETAYNPPPICDASLCAEMIGWGYDSYYSLGMGESARQLNLGDERDEIFTPRPLPLLRNILMEKVRMIACSSRHSILLTRFGNMYACGDNTDGALGLGDLVTRHTFTLIDWTIGDNNKAAANNATIPKVTHVAVGCGVIGTHSVCVDVEGVLYSWGYSKATGLGTTKAVTSPFPISLTPPASETVEEMANAPATARDVGGQKLRIRSVACGDCFTVCVTTTGHVYSWGQWSHGRLGLGSIPQATAQKSLKKRNMNKLARYQLRPARILNIDNAVSVACGEAHTLCTLASGHLLAWGQNSLGQIGVGPSRSGLLKDVFSPLVLSHFGPPIDPFDESMTVFLPKDNNLFYEFEERKPTQEKTNAAQVYCGAFHSICVDHKGQVWTWGARGSPCLGQADSMLLGEWSTKINGLFSISTNETQVMVPYELLNWCMKWSMPRLVIALSDVEIVNIVAGDLHTVFHGKDGRIFLCGSGPVVPGFEPPARQYDEDSSKHDNQESSFSGEGIKGYLVTNPRCPSSSWMKELCTKTIQYIAGAGSRMFIVVDEEFTSTELTTKLYKKLLLKEEEEDDDNSDNISVDSRYTDVSSRYNSYFDSRGKADCMIIASGHVFLCHRALLACRSSELRNMVLMESPTDGTDAIIQILLPELHYDAAKALFFYLYRDILPTWSLSNVSILHSLIRCSKTLHMPRLQLLCERFVDLMSNQKITSMEQIVNDLPPATMCKDLGSLVGDLEFADVRFIAEGRTIAAHRFILEARCEYFRVMFQSGMKEGQVGANQMLDVVVPGTRFAI